MTHRFALCTILTKYEGPAAWYFLTIPKKESAEIKKREEKKPRRGWGSVRVRVTIGGTTWDTSIFPDKGGVYLLPVKAQVRKREGLFDQDRVRYTITLL